ncbi:hypothetical protein VP01_2083g2 [Puccinia sorghi]|uniref:Uncharacterized protein n=1 Tax=Puccinia sorghi TaxID=27349 RepID=A0A0L6VAK7_9BASI|nr:hypothetical protein VP01_2083g2 [Puccinia sorghi]
MLSVHCFFIGGVTLWFLIGIPFSHGVSPTGPASMDNLVRGETAGAVTSNASSASNIGRSGPNFEDPGGKYNGILGSGRRIRESQQARAAAAIHHDSVTTHFQYPSTGEDDHRNHGHDWHPQSHDQSRLENNYAINYYKLAYIPATKWNLVLPVSTDPVHANEPYSPFPPPHVPWEEQYGGATFSAENRAHTDPSGLLHEEASVKYGSSHFTRGFTAPVDEIGTVSYAGAAPKSWQQNRRVRLDQDIDGTNFHRRNPHNEGPSNAKSFFHVGESSFGQSRLGQQKGAFTERLSNTRAKEYLQTSDEGLKKAKKKLDQRPLNEDVTHLDVTESNTDKPGELVEGILQSPQRSGNMPTNKAKDFQIMGEAKDNRRNISTGHIPTPLEVKEAEISSSNSIRPPHSPSIVSSRGPAPILCDMSHSGMELASSKKMKASGAESGCDVESPIASGSSSGSTNESGMRRRRKGRAGQTDMRHFPTLDQIHYREALSSSARHSEDRRQPSLVQPQKQTYEGRSGDPVGEFEAYTDQNKRLDHHVTEATEADPKREAEGMLLKSQLQDSGASKLHLPSAPSKNKFELLSDNLPSDSNESEPLDCKKEAVNPVTDAAALENSRLLAKTSRVDKKGRSMKPEPSLGNGSAESSEEEAETIKGSYTEILKRKIMNPFSLLETTQFTWINALKTNKPDIFNISLKLNSLFSAVRRKGGDIISQAQAVLRKKPLVSEADKPINPQSANSKIPVLEVPEKGNGQTQKRPKKSDLLTKSRIKKTKLAPAMASPEDVVPSNISQSPKRMDYTLDRQVSSGAEEALNSETKGRKEILDQGKPVDPPKDYEKRYLATFPNLGQEAVGKFRLLGEALRAEKLGWDFTIRVDPSITEHRALLKVLKSPSKKVQEWFMKEIGDPEGRRRFEAIQRQIRQAEILKDWNHSLTPREREQLKTVDRYLQVSKPWPTYTDLTASKVSSFEKLISHKTIQRRLSSVIGTEDLEIRRRNMRTMTARWSSYIWFTEEEVRQINQQALNLRLIILVGDCLRFGKLIMTSKWTVGGISAEKAYELLANAWTQKSPWFTSPERAWIMMDPERASLYTERLDALKGFLAEGRPPTDKLVSAVDPKHRLRLTEDPWWHLGYVLVWQEQGLDLFTMAKLGIRMGLKAGQRDYLSAEQIELLESASKDILLPEKRDQIIGWFHKEFTPLDVSARETKASPWELRRVFKTFVSTVVDTFVASALADMSIVPEYDFPVFMDL